MSLGLVGPSNWARPGANKSSVVRGPVTIPVGTSGGNVKIQPARIKLPSRPDYSTYYDPSRVVDLDRIRVVKDLRQSGNERGETQTGDSGILGPGSGDGSQIASPSTGGAKAPVKNNLIPIALAVAAFILLGG